MNMLRLFLVSLTLLVSPLTMSASASDPQDSSAGSFAIAIHGGAGGWQALGEQRGELEATLHSALKTGAHLLGGGGSSLDAVEQVIRILEDAPVFNAGKGAVFNAVGKHELDASIMDGSNRSSGAVAGIQVAKNPISVARLVMTNTRHVLLAGEGAGAFARSAGAQLVKPEYFWTPQTRAEWRKKQPAEKDHHGTVGCVALDTRGNLAAGTSTGGLSMKEFGRVGDSPLIGAGTWADNRSCAVSCTGVGELFIRDQIAYDIASRVTYGKQGLAAAVRHHLHDSLDEGTGGVIAIGQDGQIVLDYNTRAMPRAAADSSGRFEVLLGP